MLLAAGYIFYGFWSVKFLSLILFSTIVDFQFGKLIAGTPKNNEIRRKRLLIVSICINLGLLGFFKYYDFFATSLIDLFSLFAINLSLPLLQVVLPVGLSFYTFQSMTYTIDIYRGKLEPAQRFFDYALVVAFFPQLVAGPIERAARLLPQMTSKRIISWDKTKLGLWLIAVGLFKKAVIADNLSIIANDVFNNINAHNGLNTLAGIYAFAFQIYCDFSGYSDIARGTAKLLGFDLMINFNQPYLATNPQDFWRRWHISLSTWLRDYLYIPLGGKEHKVYRNLMITMLLGGLWHGAAMHYVLWGAYHGVLLAGYRYFKTAWSNIEGLFSNYKKLWNIVCIGFMFHITCAGWILFRVNKISDAWLIFFRLFHITVPTRPEAKSILLLAFMFVPLFILHLFGESNDDCFIYGKAPYWLKVNVLVYLMLMITFWSAHDNIPFIYFQF
jgi:D-alanyl-lipoteichoic acid acyltransferase DltB (MBOAT superfamily)